MLGLTFKEDCPDLRNSRVIDVIRELQSYGVDGASCTTPSRAPKEALHEYGIELVPWDELPRAGAIVAAVAHREFKATPAARLRCESLQPKAASYVDVKCQFDAAGAAAARRHGVATLAMARDSRMHRLSSTSPSDARSVRGAGS